VSECVITYDGVPTDAVNVMEFTDDHVTRETQYFDDPFEAPAWRAALAEATVRFDESGSAESMT
jgi:hypothetical protein